MGEVRPRLSTQDSSVLDFLRACAVLLVLVDHVMEIGRHGSVRWMGQRLGWLGVMLFFVHTSLVLMFSLERSRAEGTSLLKYFYVRRAFRIYPLSLVVVALIVAFQIPVASTALRPMMFSVGTVVSNLLLTQNLTYSQPVLGPLWSLPLEVQMYVALPFLFWMVDRGRRVGNAAWIWVLSVGLTFVQPHMTDRANVVQYAPCFVSGVVAFCLTKRRASVWPFWTWALTLAGAVATFILAAAPEGDDTPMALSWLLCLAIGVLVPNFAETTSNLIRRLSATIAKYSYGIYLTHMVALWVVFRKMPAAPIALRVIVGGGIIAALSYLAYHLVEAPGIRFGSALAQRLLERGAVQKPSESAAAIA